MIFSRRQTVSLGVAAWLLLLPGTKAGAQWVEKSARVSGTANPGLVHRIITAESPSGDTAELDLAVFNFKKSGLRLRLIDNPDRSLELSEAMARSNCLAGTNGGYFDPDFAPMGLRIVGGMIVRPARKARLLSGMILSTANSIRILRYGEYSAKSKADVALQCGPLLVDGGRPVKGLEATRQARRTLALVAGDIFALGICSGTSLAEAGEVLAAVHPIEGVPVSRALNLDGGSSTAFWFKNTDGRVFSEPEVKTVRDFLGIAPK